MCLNVELKKALLDSVDIWMAMVPSCCEVTGLISRWYKNFFWYDNSIDVFLEYVVLYSTNPYKRVFWYDHSMMWSQNSIVLKNYQYGFTCWMIPQLWCDVIVNWWPLGDETVILMINFQTDMEDLAYFLCEIATRWIRMPQEFIDDIGSGNRLVLSCNKPLSSQCDPSSLTPYAVMKS